MNILTMCIAVVSLALIAVLLWVVAMLNATIRELTDAIKNTNQVKETKDPKVRFIGPISSHFGPSPAPRKGRKKNKDWGIH
jgi:hypothetical protein